MTHKELVSLLQDHGKLEECQERDGMFHVKISDGFENNAVKTFLLANTITDANPKFPILHMFITDKNLFHLILKP